MKRLTINHSLYNSVLKNSIAGFTLICASASVQADMIHAEVDLDEPYPFMMEDGITHKVKLDIGFQFNSIERLCIQVEVEVNGGDADYAVFKAENESPGFPPIAGQWISIPLLYPIFIPTPEYPDPISRLQDFNHCMDGNNILPKNLLDRKGEIDFSVSGGNVELSSLKLLVEGDISDTQLTVTLDEPAEFLVPSYGGRVNYDASIRNLDSTQSLVTLEQWSVLKFPNGDNYPIHKSRDVILNYSESKDYTRNYLNIPAWFEAGDYELTWYVADPNTGVRVKDSLSFTKSAD
ncbi:RbmA family biofilm matrix protein [Microbulbifer sp. ZKSA002]|uniref:RbmA family biofilm matrix protein n=1 Tax=Microbulbifer sp. ZKSA002 TaxID=3243388 RepID=UPI004039F35D